MGPWESSTRQPGDKFHCSFDIFHANSSFFPAYYQGSQSYTDLPLETGTSLVLITYLLSTVVENTITQCFGKQMWIHTVLFIPWVLFLPRCTNNRSDTAHLFFPKLNYKFLFFTASQWLWPLTNTVRQLGQWWCDNHMEQKCSFGLRVPLSPQIFSFTYLYFDLHKQILFYKWGEVIKLIVFQNVKNSLENKILFLCEVYY